MTDPIAATKKPATTNPASPSGAKTLPLAGGKQPDVMAMLQKMYKNRLIAEAKNSDSKPPPAKEPDVCVTVKVKRRCKQPQQPIVAPTSAAALLKSGTAAATPPEPPPMPSVPASPAVSGYRKNVVGADSGGGGFDAQQQQNGDPTAAPPTVAVQLPKHSTSKLIVKCNIIIVTLFLMALFLGILIWFIIFVKRRRHDSLIGTTASQTMAGTPSIQDRL